MSSIVAAATAVIFIGAAVFAAFYLRSLTPPDTGDETIEVIYNDTSESTFENLENSENDETLNASTEFEETSDNLETSNDFETTEITETAENVETDKITEIITGSLTESAIYPTEYKSEKHTETTERITEAETESEIIPTTAVNTTHEYTTEESISEYTTVQDTTEMKETTEYVREIQTEAMPSADTILEKFYFAHFDLGHTDGVVTSIQDVIMRFKGTVDEIDIDVDDFTDIILIKDGIPVDNKLTYRMIHHGYWQNMDITDFYFGFENEVLEPGVYSLTGKYKGEYFEVYRKTIEVYPIGDIPANPDNLCAVAYGGGEGEVTSVMFIFHDNQQKFNISDLTNLKLTRDGEEIEFSFKDEIARYFDYDNVAIEEGTSTLGVKLEYMGASTTFGLDFTKPLTVHGTYVFTGNYMGKEFISADIIVPFY